METIALQHENEVASGDRFEFGKNWTAFLRVLDEERIANAVESLRDMLGVSSLEGLSFLDIGSGSGLFSELFAQMKKDGNPGEMSEKEKTISFLNRYFIFRKTHDVNAEKVAKTLKAESHAIETKEEKKASRKKDENAPFIRRLKQKIVLQ